MDEWIEEIFRSIDEQESKKMNSYIPPDPMTRCIEEDCDDRAVPGRNFCEAHRWLINLSASEQDRIMAEPEAIADDWLYYLKGGIL